MISISSEFLYQAPELALYEMEIIVDWRSDIKTWRTISVKLYIKLYTDFFFRVLFILMLLVFNVVYFNNKKTRISCRPNICLLNEGGST